MDFLDLGNATEEQTMPSSAKRPAGQLSARVQERVNADDLLGAVAAYRQETRASLKVALAVIKVAIGQAQS